MPIDTLTFFYVALCGFMTVWTFRYFTNRKEKYSEFEWLGLSAFWGVAVLGLWGMIPDSTEKTKIFANPFAAGFMLSFVGILLGYGASRISKMGWFAWLFKFLGRDGRDKSGNIPL